MKALISDIHSNLEALSAVLADIGRHPVEAIYCLGDVIGYGPNPRECLDRIMRCPVVLLGNHDQAVLFDPMNFNPVAERATMWTRDQLDRPVPNRAAADARWEFLAERPMKHRDGDFLLVHGSPRNPLNEYIFPEDIYSEAKMRSIFAQVPRYMFQGHTHVPGIFTEALDFLSPDEIDYEYRLDGRKTLCNVGSVGQPRDGDWRACYVLLDGTTIRFRRVEYDVETTVGKIREIDELDDFLADRLRGETFLPSFGNLVMTPRLHWIALALLLFAAPAPNAVAQGLEYVKAHYTKYEYRIPMRDGKKLFTAVYVPKDQSKRYPILLLRTPYNVKPYGVDSYKSDLGPSALFGKAGYIFAYQDVRGRWMSEGEFVNMRPHNSAKKDNDIDESSDTWDTIEFLIKRVPINNGRVGQWGISYPGFYTAAGMIDAHPALKASSPQAPVTDWFIGDDWHHNGALFLPHMFNFMASFGRPRTGSTKKFDHKFDHEMPDGYQFFLRMGPLANANTRYFKNDVAFWSEAMKHGTYDDFWKARNLRQHLKNIRPAVMTVGGWFDAENLFGALETFKKVEATSEGGSNILVMGPWRHGGWSRGDGESLGDVHFNSKTSPFFREQIEFPFFEFHLKETGKHEHPKAWVFETGTNQWRKYDAWPPKTAKRRSLYLHAKGKLTWKKPENSETDSCDEYISDPQKPVPYLDKIVIGMSPEYMVADQRFAARRPDVLLYETDVLNEDVTIAGPIQVDLHVSTTGTDSDWIVKLIDVYPDDYPDPNPNPTGVRMGGYQQLVRGDVMRGKFRKSFEKPEPFTPGKPAAVSFTMQDSSHTFRSGHRIMVQVQSSWFPLVDRNPQTFVDIYQAKESDFHKATQRVYRSREMPSRLSVLLLP